MFIKNEKVFLQNETDMILKLLKMREQCHACKIIG